MEGDEKSLKEPGSPEGERTNPQTVQEYEFFVRQGAGETGAMSLAEQKPGGVKEKNSEQNNKSRIFFSSIEETDT